MKKLRHLAIILIILTLLNSCAKEPKSSSGQACPQNEIVSMKINGEEKQFQVVGRGIDFDNVNSGHALHLDLFNGVFSPQQDSYAISLKLPYERTGDNVIREIRYLRVHGETSAGGSSVQEKLRSVVKVNTNSCVSLTFSGSIIINGNEILITDGILDHNYDDPF